MDKKELRSLLAGLSLAALVGATGLAVSGCATTGATSGADKPQSADSSEITEDTFTG